VRVIQSHRFTVVDALRAVAAMWVVLFHAVEGEHINRIAATLPNWINSALGLGNAGVAIFFVLSGFVIAHSLYEKTMSPSLCCRFMVRRSIRLDPPYWIAIIFTVAMAYISAWFVVGKNAPQFSIGQILAHVVYAQDLLGYENINTVFWTLCIELQFYLFYCLLLMVGGVATVAVSGILALAWPLGLLSENIIPGLFAPLWFGFFLGVVAYWSYRAKTLIPWFWCYAILVLMFAVIRADSFAAVCACTAGFLSLMGSADWLGSAFAWGWLQFLGAISYSLYLIHNPVTGATFRIGLMLTTDDLGMEALWWAVSIVACISVAFLLWLCVERPSVTIARMIQLSETRPFMARPS
jgi:peptidoglycan/LPS O-acetylase OafA/YrhL